MKILYGLAGSGNGHISRAISLLPEFRKYAEVDVLISGKDFSLKPPFEVKFYKEGLTLFFGRSGKVDAWKSINSTNLVKLVKDIVEIDAKSYDLIISDFEPITAWAAKINNIKCVAINNIISLLSDNFPKERELFLIEKAFLKWYSPGSVLIGLALETLGANIFTPIIPRDVREKLHQVESKKHFTVYLPSYSVENLTKYLKHIPEELEIFCKYTDKNFTNNNLKFFVPNRDKFLTSLATSRGIITSSSFQTPAEALFLGKKILAIPMSMQIEQITNAAALRKIGVKTIKKLDKNFSQEFEDWEKNYQPIQMDYKDQTEEIVKKALEK
jgi:uncharacterized protein (TIGR00661 family)